MNQLLKPQIQIFKTYKTFDSGILELTCQSIVNLLIQSKSPQILNCAFEPFTKFLSAVTKKFSKNHTLYNRIYLALEAMIFNISSNFEKNKNQIENSLVQSTGSEEFNQKEIVQHIVNLQSNIRNYFQMLINSNELNDVIEQFKDCKNVKIKELSILCQTIDYVIEKYEIRSSIFEKSKARIQQLILIEIQEPQTKLIKSINQILFSGKIKKLIKLLQKSLTKQSSFSIARLIDANFIKGFKDRTIFLDCKYTGQIILQHLIQHLVNINTEGLLFSETQQKYFVFKFILHYMVFKFGPTYLKFSEIFNRFQYLQNQTEYYQKNKLHIGQLVTFVSNLNKSKLGNFLFVVYNQVRKKYNSGQSIQLLKLFVLNRFLLNPEIKIIFNKENFNKNHYVFHANRIRNLFFPDRINNLSCPPILDYSKNLYDEFAKMLKMYDSQIEQKKSIYFTDRILFEDYLQLHQISKKIEFIGEDEKDMTSKSKNIDSSAFKYKTKQSKKFDTPGLSTVQKKIQTESDLEMSEKLLIHQIKTNRSRNIIITQNKLEKQNIISNKNNKEKIIQQNHDDSVIMHQFNQEKIIEQLQNLRTQILTKNKQRRLFQEANELKRHRNLQKFLECSDNFNAKKQQILISRNQYQLFQCTTQKY